MTVGTEIRFSLRPALRCAVIATVMFAAGISDAAPGSGAGARAGGGGRMAQSSISGANRSMSSGGNRSEANAANLGGNKVASGNRGNNNKVNTGNVGNKVNTGDINIGNDVNINIDNDYGHHHGWGYDHPVAAGIAIGAMAVTTAAVIGSYYYALPPGCTTVLRNGFTYHYCGTVYYQQTWSGNNVVYVVVNP